MYRFALIFAIFCIAHGAIEEEVYIESLAANIEKSGLLPNFAQSWRTHLDTWIAHNHHEREWNDTHNGTGPTPIRFNCNTTGESSEMVHSVHKLHPSNIGIIGALGASFVAGSGADATRLLEATLQYRGVSFPIGGDGNLSNTETLANILKEYNPRIRGWSRNIAPAWFEELSQLNVAVPGAEAKDLDDQAKEIIKRINAMHGARDQWKVLTIYIGMNDLCEACDKKVSGKASTYARRIKSALDKLHKDLTRTVVNLIALPPMHQWYRQLHDDRVCIALHTYLCPCIMHPKVDALAWEYNAELYKLTKDYERADFTVVVQPFMSGKIQFPKTTINGTEKTDQSYFAPDCFHFSRKGHAAAAGSLWTNMFQGIREKSQGLNFTATEVSCPDQNCSFIRTWANSRNCTVAKIHPDWTTLLPIFENISQGIWNLTHNFTRPPYNPSWNLTGNYTAYFTLRPYDQKMQRMVQQPFETASKYTSASSVGWIAFGVILALGLVGTVIIITVDLKKRQRKRYDNERTPLLTGSNVEQMY